MTDLVSILFFAAFLVFVVPLRWKGIFTAFLVATGVAATSLLAVRAIGSDEPVSFLPVIAGMQGMPVLVIDRLSAFFILVINFTALTGIFYALGYMKHYHKGKSPLRFSIHFFSYFWLWLSMVLITCLQDGYSFLIAWEFMTLSSFLLVIFDAEDRTTLKTGVNYLIQMHVGMLFLLIAFLIVGQAAGVTGFGGLKAYFSNHSNLLLFSLFFVGFGIKAGFMPLHTWLPQAHPAAPSHVSALMSGVMIKMGIFGILRVLSFVQSDLLAIGLIILGVSLFSGTLGVMMAIVQHDLKKLLAYHSIENIGIIGIGIGLGTIGLALSNPVLAVLGFAGGLLHVLNHSLFKSLLFFNAGSVYQAARTRNLGLLGGLIKGMPFTASFFLLGSLAICGLPPLNGFISEYLIYMGMFKSVSGSDLYLSLVILFSIIGLTLIGGMAIFCFTKAFGIVFLGQARSEDHLPSGESKWIMIVPQVAVGALILTIGLAPAFFVKNVLVVISGLYGLETPHWIFGSTIGDLQVVSIMGGLVILIALVIWIIRKLVFIRKTATYGPTWGCGYTAGDERQQYTATSFADNFTTLARPVLHTRKENLPIRDEEIFPEKRSFSILQTDVIKKYLVDMPIQALLGVMKKISFMQTGQIQHYILYAFLFMLLVFLLTFFNLI